MIDFHDTEAIRIMSTTFVENAKPFEMKNSTYASILEHLEELSAKIFTTYIGDESPREINILYSTKNKLCLDIEMNLLHPNIFAHSFHHIAKMVHDNFFLKFLKHASDEDTDALPTSKDPDSTTVKSSSHSFTSRSNHLDKQSITSRSSGRSNGGNLLAPKSAISCEEVIAESQESDKISFASSTTRKLKPALLSSGRGGRGGRG